MKKILLVTGLTLGLHFIGHAQQMPPLLHVVASFDTTNNQTRHDAFLQDSLHVFFHGNGVVDSVIAFTYRVDSARWEFSTKSFVYYNSNGRVDSVVRYQWRYWDSPMVWQRSYKKTISYNAQGKPDTIMTYSYISNSYMPSERYIYHYVGGKLDSMEQDFYNVLVYPPWTPFKRTRYTYTNNRLTEILEYSYPDSAWYRDEKSTFTYNSAGRLQQWTMWGYDTATQQWDTNGYIIATAYETTKNELISNHPRYVDFWFFINSLSYNKRNPEEALFPHLFDGVKGFRMYQVRSGGTYLYLSRGISRLNGTQELWADTVYYVGGPSFAAGYAVYTFAAPSTGVPTASDPVKAVRWRQTPNVLEVELSEPVQMAALMTPSGQVIHGMASSPATRYVRLSMAGLPAGTYMLQLINTKGEQTIHRFVHTR